MPLIQTAPGVSVSYRVDDFTDPWAPAPTVLMIHGLAESGEAFRAFVPALARRARVARMDLRGYGDSPALPADHPWRFDALVEDVVRVVDALGAPRVHLVGGKIGGTIALAVAAAFSVAWWATGAEVLVGSARRESGRLLSCSYLGGTRVVERQYLFNEPKAEEQTCPLVRFG